MESIKRNRILCTLVTSALTYTGMLLSGLSVMEDEKNQWYMTKASFISFSESK